MKKEEKTYKKLLEDLKNLPKVDAPKNFETELLRKINSSSEKKESFWDKLLSPGKLAPAAIAIASAAIIFFVVDVNSEEMEDPLTIAPRLREDLAVMESVNKVSVDPLKKSVRVKEEIKDINKGLMKTKDVERQNEADLRLENPSDLKSISTEQSIHEELISDKSDADSFRAEETRNLGGNIAPSPLVTSSSEINKDNLNFMQRNLSNEEKKEVKQLKMRVQTEKGGKTEQNSNKLP
jgi:hypothetical protein